MAGANSEQRRGPDFHIDIGELISPDAKATLLTMLPDKLLRTKYANNGPEIEPMPTEIPQYHVLPEGTLFQAIDDRLWLTDKYQRTPIHMPVLTFLRANHQYLRKLGHDLFIGNFSATDRTDKVKYVTEIPYTRTEYAKAYIELCELSAGRKLKPIYSKEKDICKTPPVLYFSKPYKGELAYVDISAAYWQILWPTTIDMVFNPESQSIEADGQIPYIMCDQFAKDRKIRHVLHTLFHYRTTRKWIAKTGRGPIVQKAFQSPIYRPYNYDYILKVMHAIATEISQKFTLCQWLTDAAIVPADQADALQEYLLEEWFLDSRLKYKGKGYSNKLNSYSIGSKQTGGYDANLTEGPHSTLVPSNVETLKSERLALIHDTPYFEPPVVKKKVFHVTLDRTIPVEIKPKIKPTKPPKNWWGSSNHSIEPPDSIEI